LTNFSPVLNGNKAWYFDVSRKPTGQKEEEEDLKALYVDFESDIYRPKRRRRRRSRFVNRIE